MSDNKELFKGVPTPKSAAPSVNTNDVPKVEAEEDDTRTRKTVKLSAAGMMPDMAGAPGRVTPDDISIPRPAPQPSEAPSPTAADSPTVKLRPVSDVPKAPSLMGKAPAAASTDTGSVPKQPAEEDTRTRRTVRINASTVEDTVKIQRGAATPAPAPGAAVPPPAAAPAAEKPKLTLPKPAAAKPAEPAAAAAPAAAAPAAEAKAEAAPEAAPGRAKKEKAGLNLKKDEGEKAGPSRVTRDMDAISRKKSAGDASQAYTIMAVLTVVVLLATLWFSSSYLNVWSPEWAYGFTLLK